MTLRYLLRSCLALAFLLTASGANAQSDLVITGIADGDLPGGLPKAIEMYVLNDIPDLSVYALGTANNGGGTDGPELALSGSASAGDFLYAASETTDFTTYFGFAPDFDASTTTNAFSVSVNGDDAVELFYDAAGFPVDLSTYTGTASVTDTFGDINTDGSGEAWEYADGWVYRMDATGPDGTTFETASWTYGGVGALNDAATNDAATSPFPVGTYGVAAGPALIITGIADGDLPGGLPKAIEFYALTDIADLSVYAVGTANNGGGTDGPELALFGSASAGDFLYAGSETADFTTYFGFAPDFDASTTTNAFSVSVNGDDAVELFYDAAGFPIDLDAYMGTADVIDTFGDINTDGSGEAWEYADGWVYRMNGSGPDGTMFVTTNWMYGGVGALNDATTNAAATSPFPVGMYSTTPNMGPQTFTALARGEFEVPAVETEAKGGITATLNGTMLTVSGAFAYLESDYNTNIGAHLHGGAANENGPVRYALTPVLDADNRGGTFQNMFMVRETFADSLRAGLVYFNLHTVDQPMGEIRGQLGTGADNLPVALSGDQEVPPFETDASGAATVTVNGTMVTVEGSFEGLTGDYQASHVHAGARGANGPVVFALEAVVPVGGGVTSGAWASDLNMFEVSTTFADSLRAGLAYINVHSSASPSGEIRGQIGFEDEMAIEPMTLADIRAGGVGQEVAFEGVVTRAQGRISFVQDETAGIAFFQGSGAYFDAIASGAIASGDSIRVVGTTSEFNGLFQIGTVADFEVISRGNDLPVYQSVTLAEIAANGEAYESELIQVRDLMFSEQGAFAAGTTYQIGDQGGAVTLRTPSATDNPPIAGVDIPQGAAIFRGILGQFDGEDPRDSGYQLNPIAAMDVVVQGDASMLVINEILFDPADEIAGDANGDGTRNGSDDEFVEIVNAGTESVDLGNFVIEDGASLDSDDETFIRHRFPVGTVLEAGQAVVVFGGGVPTGTFGSSLVQTASNGSLGLNNSGDTVTLADAAITANAGGNVIATVVYDNAVQNESIARIPDLTGEFVAHSTNSQNPVLFSPGVSNLTGGGGGFPSAGEETPDGTLSMVVANPLRSSARVRFALPASGEASLTLYDALGRRVAVLAEGDMASGEHGATLNASSLAPGVYILRLLSSGAQVTQTVTVVR